KYLLVTVTICFSLGIAFSLFSEHSFHIPPILVAVLFLICFLLWLCRFTRAMLLFFCCSLFFSGMLLATNHRSSPGASAQLTNLLKNGTETAIIGVLAEHVSGNDVTQKAIIDAVYYRTSESSHFLPITGTILLTLTTGWHATILPGDSVIFKTELRTPRATNTPGTFNYKEYLAKKGIYRVGTISSPLMIQPVVNRFHHRSPSSYRVERARAIIAQNLSVFLPATQSGLYRALLLGDKTGVPVSVIEAFKGAGVMHILAISGMHMSLLGIFIFSIMYWLLRRSEYLILTTNVKKLSVLFCIPVLCLYTLLAGANTPVLRSFVMSLFVVFALCINRKKSTITILAGAALILLLFDPLALGTASFQLSFAAVGTIIMISPKIRSWASPVASNDSISRFKNGLIRWLKIGVMVSFAATLGTAPLLLYHFNRLSLVTIPANIIIEPLLCLWSLPIGFVALFAMFIYTPLAGFLLQIGAVGLNISVTVASFFNQLPISTLWLPSPSLSSITLYYLALAGLLTVHHIPLLKWPIRAGFASSLLLFLLPVTPLVHLGYHTNKVSFIDIGQGSASIIELSNGRTIVVDGGALSAPDFDCGERILAPFLWHRGIGKVDDIVVTHADADHYSGLPTIIKRFSVKRLWLPHLNRDKKGYADLCDLAKRQRTQIHVPDRNIIFLDKNARLELLGDITKIINKHSDGKTNSQDENDNGLVLKLTTPNFSVIFPGDISRAQERKLVLRSHDLRANILLSPHHGSSTSNSEIFYKAIQPDYLVISAGKWKNSRFPSQKTLLTAERMGIRVLNTAKDGTILVEQTKDDFKISSFLAQ
ncbi:MAG: DNA internalization-related competence protein ComEC/Rec2, partial [Desulfobacterales bacterium]|nr:DNA internalization-related competence protein ComEC/Rec2 [Desulfobacterales bacterium]